VAVKFVYKHDLFMVELGTISLLLELARVIKSFVCRNISQLLLMWFNPFKFSQIIVPIPVSVISAPST